MSKSPRTKARSNLRRAQGVVIKGHSGRWLGLYTMLQPPKLDDREALAAAERVKHGRRCFRAGLISKQELERRIAEARAEIPGAIFP